MQTQRYAVRSEAFADSFASRRRSFGILMGQLSGLAWRAQLQRLLRLCRAFRTVSSTLVTVPATRGYAVYWDIYLLYRMSM